MNWLSVALLPLYLFLLIQVELASAQTDSVAFTGKPDFFNGVVINRKKYSFSVAFDKNPGTVRLSPNTTIAARIVRPSFDWGAQVVRGVIPVSAEDGRVVNNREVEFALPDKLYFRYSFESPAAMAKMLELETIQLEQPVLSRTILPDAIIDGDNPQWTGQLQPTAKPGLFQVTLNGRKKNNPI